MRLLFTQPAAGKLFRATSTLVRVYFARYRNGVNMASFSMGRKMIEISHLVKQFGTLQAVNDLSFSVAPGEVLGFLGPNGAGKSTTMKIVTRVSQAECGPSQYFWL